MNILCCTQGLLHSAGRRGEDVDKRKRQGKRAGVNERDSEERERNQESDSDRRRETKKN